MRIRDLLPDKDALITRDYWLKRSQLGQPIVDLYPYLPCRRPPLAFRVCVMAFRSATREKIPTGDTPRREIRI